MGQVPRYRGRHVGRVADIERVEAALGAGALVTLSGPGGIGKTRLAAEVGWRRRPRRTRWVDAGSADTGSRLCDVLLQGFEAQGGFRPDLLDPVDRAAALLAEQEDVLCVVDRFEHLAASEAGLIARWRSEAPGVTFLVTSRNALGLDGEHVVSLGPLDVDSARGLLAAHSGLVLDETDEAVRRILARLEGVPLAIELAAARLAVLTLPELAERLDESLALLRDPLARPDSPHATLRNTVLWSWSLLSAWEQAALVQLTVFRGGIAGDAARAVLDLGVSEDVAGPVDALQSLASKSLLRPDPTASRGPRRFLLYDVAVEVVQARPGVHAFVEAARHRHAIWFADEAQRWAFGKAGSRADREHRLQIERANIAAALDYAVDAAPSPGRGVSLGLAAAVSRADRRLHGSAGALDRLDRVLATPGLSSATDVGARARARLERARLLRYCLRDEEAKEELRVTIDEAHEAGRETVECFALGMLSDLMSASGETEAGLELLERTHAFSQRIGDRSTEAIALVSLALRRDLERDGDPGAAAQHLEAAVALNRALEDDLNLVVALTHRAWVLALDGRDAPAGAAAAEARDIVRRLDIPHLIAFAVGWSGVVEAMGGRPEEARSLLDEALASLAASGQSLFRLEFLRARAAAALELGEHQQAVGGLRCAFGLAEAALSPEQAAGTSLLLGLAELTQGSVEAAAAQATGVLAANGPVLSRLAHPLARAVLGLARASQAGGIGPVAQAAVTEAEAAVGAAQTCHGPEWAPVVARLMRAAVARAEAWLGAWTIAEDGATFAGPETDAVDLRRRKALARVLAALASEREAAPGQSLSAPELIRAGWPGQEPLQKSGQNRLYVALSELRKLGLTILQRQEGGWRLDPDVPLRRPRVH